MALDRYRIEGSVIPEKAKIHFNRQRAGLAIVFGVLVPQEAGQVFDRLLQLRGTPAQPVTT